MNPVEAFQSLLMRMIISSRRWKNVPGAMVEGMPPDARQALSELKSEDVNSSQIRDEDIKLHVGDEYDRKQKIHFELLEFDKKIKK